MGLLGTLRGIVCSHHMGRTFQLLVRITDLSTVQVSSVTLMAKLGATRYMIPLIIS